MKKITQTMLYRQSLILYAQKHGVTKAAIRYRTNRQYIYRRKRRYDGTLESLADKSHRPRSHPNQHTELELKLIADIPEGVATATLLLAGGAKKRNTVLLSTLTGAPTILGAAIGYFVGNMSDIAMALTTSAVAGIILYMIFEGILPQSVAAQKARITTVFTLIGIIVGIAAIRR